MYLLIFIILVIPITQKHFVCDAACRGSVIFYWTEKGEDRIANMRNWGLLEKKLRKRKYEDLTEYFNPKNVYAYTVEGDCCWKIYTAADFEEDSAKLKHGFHGIPGYPKFNVNSMKKVKC